MGKKPYYHRTKTLNDYRGTVTEYDLCFLFISYFLSNKKVLWEQGCVCIIEKECNIINLIQGFRQKKPLFC